MTYAQLFENDFDKLFKHLIYNFDQTNYPVINEGTIDGIPFVEIAVTGFDKDNVSVDFNRRNRKLTINAKGQPSKENIKYRTRQIAKRGFEKSFWIANRYEIDFVELKNGLLHIRFKESEEEKNQIEVISIR